MRIPADRERAAARRRTAPPSRGPARCSIPVRSSDLADPVADLARGRSRGSPGRTRAPPRPSRRRSAWPGPGASSRSCRAMSRSRSSVVGLAGDPDRAGQLAGVGVRDQAVDRPDQRALAAARRAGHEEDLARRRPSARGRGSRARSLAGSGRSGPRPRRAARSAAPVIVTGRSTVRPSRRAASPWLSASDRLPSESAISTEAPSGTLPNVIAPDGVLDDLGGARRRRRRTSSAERPARRPAARSPPSRSAASRRTCTLPKIMTWTI